MPVYRQVEIRKTEDVLIFGQKIIIYLYFLQFIVYSSSFIV